MSNHCHPENLSDVYFLHCLRLYGLYLMLLSLWTTQWVQKGSCKCFLWMQFLAATSMGCFVFSAYCLIWISLDHRQTHTPVLPPSSRTGPKTPLCSILPAGHCETGATQQRPRACCVRWRGVFIWGKTRLGLLTKLVKSETWHFVLLQGLLKYKVCWALWNENLVQWLIWYIATDTSSCWPLHREDSKGPNSRVQLKGLFWAEFESFSEVPMFYYCDQPSFPRLLYCTLWIVIC